MPTILLKKSDTPGSVPGTANLTNLAGGVEVAVNTADKRMFSMTSASAVIELGTNPSSLTCADASFTVARITSLTISSLSLTNATFASATITNLTSTSATISSALTLSGGTANGVLYLNGSKVATSGSALTFDGNDFIQTGANAAVSFRVSSSNAGVSASNYSEIQLADAGGVRTYWRNLRDGSGATIFSGNDHIRYSLSGTEQMRLTSTGLGIGTSSPAFKLDIQASEATAQLQSTTGTNTVQWSVKNTGGTFYQGIESSTSGNFGVTAYSGVLWHTGAYPIVFATNNGERMRLDSSGNLGLGVTPSAWGANYKALQVTNSALAVFNSNSVALANNAYDTGVGAWKYFNSAAASFYNQSSGSHAWYTAPSGTAGNAISFTQAMTLDASGNLGIGTTSPAKKLHVAGNAIGGSVSARIENTDATSAATFAQLELITGLNTAGISAVSGSGGDGYLAFTNENTERARITSGGYFKASNAGTYLNSTGAYHEFRSDGTSLTLQVSNTNASPQGVYVEYSSAAPNGTGNVFLLCADNVGTRAAIRSNGGLANYQANNVDLSDVRTKKEINPAASMWDKIGALEIVTYKYNDQTHDDVNLGVIAQQVEAVEPVWVDPDGFGETPEDGVPLKTVYNKDIYFAAIKALQEAMARIEQLEAKVAALESK